jgi:hypothetical protein
MIVINSTKYQQNEQSPLILTELTEHKKTTCDLGNPGPSFGQAQKRVLNLDISYS